MRGSEYELHLEHNYLNNCFHSLTWRTTCASGRGKRVNFCILCLAWWKNGNLCGRGMHYKCFFHPEAESCLVLLVAEYQAVSRAEQDLAFHHRQLIIKSNIIFNNRTYASASFKLHFLPVRSISVNQTAFRKPLLLLPFSTVPEMDNVVHIMGNYTELPSDKVLEFQNKTVN